jgi:hypothetical protein
VKSEKPGDDTKAATPKESDIDIEQDDGVTRIEGYVSLLIEDGHPLADT